MTIHQFPSAFLANMAPLLVPVDLGFGVDDVTINIDHYDKVYGEEIDPEDMFMLT